MAKKGAEPLKVGILVRDDLAEESIEVAKRRGFAAPELRRFLVGIQQRAETVNRRIKHGVHGLMVGNALPLFRFEIHFAEPEHFFGSPQAR
jgi:hypothetical protein